MLILGDRSTTLRNSCRATGGESTERKRQGTWKTSSILTASAIAAIVLATSTSFGDVPAFESLVRHEDWINSPALRRDDLQGKVVLVDFWTYTCVNWMRTLPYLRDWSTKYRDDGLVVIGVHSPEFTFEAKRENVVRAAGELGVTYPVAVDSDHAIWRAYHNQYWPAVYLIDARGRVRFRHVGESGYEELEKAVTSLLAERTGRPVTPESSRPDAPGAQAAADWDNLRSGENYLGRARTINFASPEGLGGDRPRNYRAPQRLSLNHWALTGRWTITPEASVLERAGGRVTYRFHARDANLVMGVATLDNPVRFRVLLDGEPPGDAHGTDVDDAGYGTVLEPRMYQLIRQPVPILDRTLEIEFLEENVATFSFTFG